MRDARNTVASDSPTSVLVNDLSDGEDPGWPRSAFWLTVATAGALAILLTYEGLHLGFFHGQNELDDGVYYGEGVMLSHGILPYQSYIDLQPPGIALLMAPFGLLGRVTSDRSAFELARVFVAVVGVANIGLFGRLVRRRRFVGILAGLVTFGFYVDSLIAEHTILLEPFLVFGTLLALIIVFGDGEIATSSPNRWLAAGVVLGLTTSVKLWEVFVVVAFLVFAARRGLPCLFKFTIGIVAAVGAVCGPFFLLAPARFIQEVIVVQASRSYIGQFGEKFRLWNLLGVPGLGHFTLAAPLLIPLAIWIVFLLAVIASILLGRRSNSMAAISSLDVCAIACLVLVGISFLAAPEYYSHYGSFIAPFLALVVSSTVVRLEHLAKPIVIVVTIVSMMSYAALSSLIVLRHEKEPLPSAALDRIFKPTACVLSREYAPLIIANRYNLFEKGCPRVLDIFGTELSDGNGIALVSSDATATKLQNDWLRWLRRADGVVLLTPLPGNADMGRDVRSYFLSHFTFITESNRMFIYRRNVHISTS